MSKEPTETTVRVWARLMRAQQTALAGIELALKQAGLPPLVWYDVLLEVERAGATGLRPFEIEHAMLLEQSNLSRLLDRMERAGVVKRQTCSDDGRGQRVVASRTGRALRRKMWPVYAAAIEAKIGQKLSEDQVSALDALLGVLGGRPD